MTTVVRFRSCLLLLWRCLRVGTCACVWVAGMVSYLEFNSNIGRVLRGEVNENKGGGGVGADHLRNERASLMRKALAGAENKRRASTPASRGATPTPGACVHPPAGGRVGSGVFRTCRGGGRAAHRAHRD